MCWIIHLRVAVTADGISQGLSALPGILVPYSGINDWARVVMLLGAAVLLLDAGMLLAFAPPALGDVRRAGAALPLIALVVVPATLVHPHLAYLQGLVLFALLAFFMWGERVAPDRRGSVVLACAATGAIGMIVAPGAGPALAVDQLRGADPRLHPGPRGAVRLDAALRAADLAADRQRRARGEGLAQGVDRGVLEGREPRHVRRRRMGRRRQRAEPRRTPSASGRSRRYTQTLTVTIRAMTTNQVIAAGYAQQPAAPLEPGAAGVERRDVGRPAPRSARATATRSRCTPRIRATRALARAGDDYPVECAGERSAADHAPAARAGQPWRRQTILFPAFGSRGVAPQNQTSPDGVSAVGRDRELALRAGVCASRSGCGQGARTPYAYVQRVMGYLANGYTYDEYPPPTPYPLATFLFLNHLGYCQQFAGSMALLLRMGGIPARVATGFTTGTYDSATKSWLVSDVDAHAWVEAWFPGYGWVTFDPTPAAAPARGGRSAINSNGILGGSGGLSKLGGRNVGTPPGTVAGTAHASFGQLDRRPSCSARSACPGRCCCSPSWRGAGRPRSTRTRLLAELERALSRSGRPISDGVTLAALERRFRTSPEAAALRARAAHGALRRRRRSCRRSRQRRALRAQLRAGLGLGGALRALWALPPRPKRRSRARRRTA